MILNRNKSEYFNIRIENSTIYLSPKKQFSATIKLISNGEVQHEKYFEFLPGIEIFLYHPCLIFDDCLLDIGYEKISIYKEETKRVAICYWGPTRSTKIVYQSHLKFLHEPLKKSGFDFDVFIHTWKLEQNKVWNQIINSPIDYTEHLLLNPNFYKLDDQSKFLETFNLNDYFYKDVYEEFGHCENGEWMPDLVTNLVCGLTSQKRVTEMCLQSGQNYDFIIFVRPDAELLNEFPIDILYNLQDTEIAIPNFDHWEGYNDRFAVVCPKNCEKYSSRVDELIEFRKTNGRIVSEKFMKFIIDKYFTKVHLIDFNFELIRPN